MRFIGWKSLAASALIGLASLCLFAGAGSPAASAVEGEISITSVQYPGSPETVTIGEKVPIVVNIKYTNIEQSTLSLHLAYADFPPRFQSGGEVTLTGSGTYVFPPAEIMVPASYSIPSGWPKYINEWHLKAEIWKGDNLRAGKAFTLLVENPEMKPKVEISQIEYVIPPDTIAVNEQTQVKIHMKYSNFDPGTKAEAVLRDQTGILASRVSRELHGNGTLVYGLTIKPTRAGQWQVEASIQTVAGSMPFGDKKSFMINVV